MVRKIPCWEKNSRSAVQQRGEPASSHTRARRRIFCCCLAGDFSSKRTPSPVRLFRSTWPTTASAVSGNRGALVIILQMETAGYFITMVAARLVKRDVGTSVVVWRAIAKRNAAAQQRELPQRPWDCSSSETHRRRNTTQQNINQWRRLLACQWARLSKAIH